MLDQRILHFSFYYKILRIGGPAKIGRSIRIIMILSTFKYIEFESWIRILNILPDRSNLKKEFAKNFLIGGLRPSFMS